jgi:hypothetical protein
MGFGIKQPAFVLLHERRSQIAFAQLAQAVVGIEARIMSGGVPTTRETKAVTNIVLCWFCRSGLRAGLLVGLPTCLSDIPTTEKLRYVVLTAPYS